MPIPEDDRYSDETWVKSELRKILGSSIEKRMMSDVPFGVFLSGGIDSSTNVALMDAVMDRPVKTFTVGFKDHEEYNEFEHARKIRDLFKTEHHEILIDSNDMMAYLDRLVVSQDEPIADWVCVPLYFVSKLVRDSGTIVVQVGEGSDEQFIGYDHFMSLLGWLEKYWNPLRKLPKFMQAAAYGCTSLMRSIDDRWRGKKDIVYRAWKDRELFWGGGICYMEGFKNEIIKDRNHWEGQAFGENYIDDPVGWVPAKFKKLDSYGVVDEYLSKFDSRKPSADYIERMVYLEMKLRLVELLLMRVDKITMSTSVEARVPYLDHKMVEFSMNIPGALKVKNNVPKYIMKEAVRGLIPDEIIDRKKMGFDAPVKSWLRGSLGEKAESIFRNTKLRDEGLVDFDRAIDILNDHRYRGRDYGYPVWSLLNLGLWYDSWIAGEVSG
ncbi:asparagine synthase C-terminal domain-containing protein, partial [bacterium]|nr:asparagine synthase C-terminal domain-containing protein [bacterium]